MDPRSRATFLALMLAQAAHSVEEFVFRLYDVFAPARFLSGLVSSDLGRGFALLNAGIVVFGFWCYAAWVRPGHPWARAIAWSWACLELGNGIGHSLLALARGSYFPGVATAPLLLGLSIALMRRLGATSGRASGLE